MKVVKGWTVFILCIILSACAGSTEEEVQTEQRSESIETERIEKEITLYVIGYILIHDRLYADAETDDGYNFMTLLDQVEPFLNDTTITFANQETMLGGEEMGLSGYPAFNSPVQVGDALQEVGVD